MGGTEADAFLSAEWPVVEWPVVMIDGHDVRLFEESGNLQGALEPWMAYDDGAEFFDAQGRRLRPFVALYGVDVMVKEPVEIQSDRIVQVLKDYIREPEQNPPGALRRFVERLEATRS